MQKQLDYYRTQTVLSDEKSNAAFKSKELECEPKYERSVGSPDFMITEENTGTPTESERSTIFGNKVYSLVQHSMDDSDQSAAISRESIFHLDQPAYDEKFNY